MSNSVQWDDCIVCPVSLSSPTDWNLSGSWESAEEGGLDIESDMLWEHKQYCTVHSPQSVMSGRDRPWMQCKSIINSYITAFVPEWDCIREECMIFINLVSHVNLTCLPMYGKNYSVISRGVETELYIQLKTRPVGQDRNTEGHGSKCHLIQNNSQNSVQLFILIVTLLGWFELCCAEWFTVCERDLQWIVSHSSTEGWKFLCSH